MRKSVLLSLALAASVCFSSCSLMTRLGLIEPKLKVIENRTFVSAEGKKYRLKRYLISENPLETQTEIREVRTAWADR